jgi:branched-chain amino acid transport system substrate-binding protein
VERIWRLSVLFTGVMAISLVGALCGSSAAMAATKAPSVPLHAPVPAGGNGGATAVGVTPKSIKTFVVTDGNANLPGQNIGGFYGASAYYAYVNSQGGVYGRDITVQDENDQYSATTAQAECQAQIPTNFAVVGSTASAISGCFDLVKQSGIPWLGGYYLDPRYYTLSNVPNATNPNKEGNGFAQYMHKLHPTATKVALLGIDAPGLQGLLDQEAAMLKTAGFTTVLKLLVPFGAPDLTQYVVQVRNSGAQAVDGIGLDQTTIGRLAASMGQQGYNPPLKFGSNVYNGGWFNLAGSAASGWYEPLSYVPFLDSKTLNSSQGGKLFAYWMKKTNPKWTPDVYTIYGWAAAAQFVQGLIAAGPHLTRAKYLTSARAITDFTADGLIGKLDPSLRLPTTCFVAIEATSQTFKQVHPTAPGSYDCSGKLVSVPSS